MNKDLLLNPEVKEIAENYLTFRLSTGEGFNDFVKSFEEEKDWEITAFKDGDSNFFHKRENKKFASTGNIVGCYDENAFLKDPKYIIHSVKRVSDGELFTVGDYHSQARGYIEHFEIVDADVYVGFTEKVDRILLNQMEKQKQPLFTTTDGKPVYEGDEFRLWYVKPNEWKVNAILAANYWFEEGRGKIGTLKNKWFSTEQAAQEYILMNKPCLSVQDIISCARFKQEGGYMEIMENSLIQTAKQKQ